MKVKPAPGMTVRDPRTLAVLPEEGREVPDHDVYWQRRVRDADVVVEEAEAKPEEHHHQSPHHAPAREA